MGEAYQSGCFGLACCWLLRWLPGCVLLAAWLGLLCCASAMLIPGPVVSRDEPSAASH